MTNMWSSKNCIDAENYVEQKLILQSAKYSHFAKAELFYKGLKKYDVDAKVLKNKI